MSKTFSASARQPKAAVSSIAFTFTFLASLATVAAAAVGTEILRPNTQAPRGISPGRITGIGTTPAQHAQTGKPVVIVVTGSGRRCGQIRVDFGDQFPPVVVSGDFPITVPAHTYIRPGTITLKATPMSSDCDGEASTPLTLKGENLDVSSKLGIAKDALRFEKGERPEIHVVVPTTPVQHLACGLTAANYPGSELLIGGKNFGSEPGWVRMIGQFPTGIRMTLQILSWAEKEIRVKIPLIKGVLDQTIRLQVGAGKMSNEWPIPFTALRERALLPRRLSQARECGGPRYNQVYNRCGSVDSSTPFLYGLHMQLGAKNPEYGWDIFYASGRLANSWLIEGYEWLKRLGVKPQPFGILDFKECTNEQFHFAVAWDKKYSSGYSTADYKLKINIVGPAGIFY